MARPRFRPAAGSLIDGRLGPAPDWTLIPLRVPTGWSVRWNGLDARRLPDGTIELNDSEDILWLTKAPPPDGRPYATDPRSPWREVHLDAGWYRDCFRLVVLDPGWDDVGATFATDDPDALLARIEAWMLHVPDPADRG